MRLPVGPYATSIGRARDAHVNQIDFLHRGQPPTRRRHQVPEQRADEIDLDVAQPARVRPLDDAGDIGRAEQRREDAVGDDRARRRQVAVHADVAGERAQLRAGRDEVDAERQVGGRETVGGARAHRDVAVVEPRLHLRDAEPRERPANGLRRADRSQRR